MSKTTTRKNAAKRPGTHGTPEHLARRVRTLQKRMGGWKADALLITNPRDIRYLTGFVGDDSWAVVPAGGAKVYVLTDFRFEEQIQREAPHAEAVIRSGGLGDELARLVKKRKLKRVGLQSDYVTVALHRSLKDKLGKKHVTPVEDGLLAQRAVKDGHEVDAIRKALAIQQRAYRELIASLKPGRSEVELAAQLEHRMRTLGAERPSFPTIIAADANASLPHAIPGASKTRKGGSVLIDWGARWGGYCGDLTRVVALGKMSPKMREIYAVCLEAQLAAIAAIAPGKTMREIDDVARSIIKKAGYGDRFGHGLGHGIGLDIHEQPTLSWRSEGKLEPGHVVTVEPGIYLPGVGGVRIEDDVLVTARGHEVLSDLPKDLRSAII